MDGIDAVGEAVTGGLLARAVEPSAGEADGHTHEKSCLNCKTPLTGAYCSACGQKAHVHRTVRGFLQDFIQDILDHSPLGDARVLKFVEEPMGNPRVEPLLP